jgi:hypothetical protein
MSTVQHPQAPLSQETLVPVRPSDLAGGPSHFQFVKPSVHRQADEKGFGSLLSRHLSPFH